MFSRNALIAAAKSSPQGPSAPSVQKIVRGLCDLGHEEAVADALAEAILDIGLTKGRIPIPRGLKTTGLVEKALLAIKTEVETYAKTGVLCARGYYPTGKLAMLVAGKWEQQFSSVLPLGAEDVLMDHLSPEYNARAAVAAQKLYADIFSKLPRTADGEQLLLPMRDLEGVCVAAVRIMHAAFNAPDAAVHQMAHGEETHG